jgi:hypothetical protein
MYPSPASCTKIKAKAGHRRKESQIIITWLSVTVLYSDDWPSWNCSMNWKEGQQGKCCLDNIDQMSSNFLTEQKRKWSILKFRGNKMAFLGVFGNLGTLNNFWTKVRTNEPKWSLLSKAPQRSTDTVSADWSWEGVGMLGYVCILVSVRDSFIEASLCQPSQVYHCLRNNKYPFIYLFYLLKKRRLTLDRSLVLFGGTARLVEASRMNNNQVILLILKETGISGSILTTRFLRKVLK